MRIPRGTISFIKRVALAKSDGSRLTAEELPSVQYVQLVEGAAEFSFGTAVATGMVLGTWASGGLCVLHDTDLPYDFEFGVPNSLLASGNVSNLLIIVPDASQDNGTWVAARVEFELDSADVNVVSWQGDSVSASETPGYPQMSLYGVPQVDVARVAGAILDEDKAGPAFKTFFEVGTLADPSTTTLYDFKNSFDEISTNLTSVIVEVAKVPRLGETFKHRQVALDGALKTADVIIEAAD